MARHHERAIRRAQENVAAAGLPPERTEPRSRAEVESFVKGFGLSAAATRRVVDEWVADAERAYQAGWEAHADAASYEQW
jgi:hypothetical protein